MNLKFYFKININKSNFEIAIKMLPNINLQKIIK